MTNELLLKLIVELLFMIIFDLIHAESPLFAKGIKILINENKFSIDNLKGIVDGNRWEEYNSGINCINRLEYFEKLDSSNVDFKKELSRISNTYENFNIYACDRYLIKKSKAYQEKMLVYTYLFYEEIFKEGITHYFTTGIAFTYNLISYQVSKRFGIKHISFYGTRMGNRTAISLDISNTFDEVLAAYKTYTNDKVTSEMYKPIHEFVHKPMQPLYMKNAINASTIKWVFITEFFTRFDKYYLKGKHKYDVFTNSPFKLSAFKLRKIIQAKKINLLHNSIFEEVDYSEEYFIFPLHMQPEASTLVLSPFEVDQKAAIINISKLIPPNIKLYVKEHKSALGQHSLAFYKELKQYPNIKLISYKENMFELVKKSKGTINLSSTVGLESLMLKKPAMVLGNVFYNDTGLTFKVNSYCELSKVINLVKDNSFDVVRHFKDYEPRLAYYIYCLHQQSYPFEFNVAKLDTKERVLRAENVKGFARCIDKIIQN